MHLPHHHHCCYCFFVLFFFVWVVERFKISEFFFFGFYGNWGVLGYAAKMVLKLGTYVLSEYSLVYYKIIKFNLSNDCIESLISYQHNSFLFFTNYGLTIQFG